jgi:hypothetical protein
MNFSRLVKELAMNRRIMSLGAVLGVGVLIGALLPAAFGDKSERGTEASRYDGRLSLIAGGLGGLWVEVTDHQTNTLYLYATQQPKTGNSLMVQWPPDSKLGPTQEPRSKTSDQPPAKPKV